MDIDEDVNMDVASKQFRRSRNFEGGEPITLKVASELKQLCWGSASMSPKNIWSKQGISLNSPDLLFAYGIKSPQNATKNFMMCIQAYFLKHLFFETKIKGKERTQTEARRQSRFMKCGVRDDIGAKNTRKGSFKTNQLLRPNANAQMDMIVGGLADIIFKASEGEKAIFAFPGPENCFDPSAFYEIDGVTEKLILFSCEKMEDLKSVIKRFLSQITQEKGTGLLCFLYSLILTRNFERIREDLQNEADISLIDIHGETVLPLLYLVLFGKASPYLHNGTLPVTADNGETYDRVGIQERGEIGYLIWEKDEARTLTFNIGSRLKTPILPLWVTRCNGTIGILFNPNRDLLRSHSAEKRFVLYYYSNFEFKENEGKETKLIIETLNSKVTRSDMELENDDWEEPPLESLIKTKWEGATVNWNGITPYV